ncbi:hypothetical protein B296_00003671 [Ensete ventricosum]|uniref:Uncharacterized protein n=1 Tax=Ensete ventricosum TaxID=4639 RepID=A0A427BAA3_ENSVE|nr:hypothetical protein B296_00003671 [Ensete ventricosum]
MLSGSSESGICSTSKWEEQEVYLIQCCKTENLDPQPIGSQDGLLDLIIDAIGGKGEEVLQRTDANTVQIENVLDDAHMMSMVTNAPGHIRSIWGLVQNGRALKLRKTNDTCIDDMTSTTCARKTNSESGFDVVFYISQMSTLATICESMPELIISFCSSHDLSSNVPPSRYR